MGLRENVDNVNTYTSCVQNTHFERTNENQYLMVGDYKLFFKVTSFLSACDKQYIHTLSSFSVMRKILHLFGQVHYPFSKLGRLALLTFTDFCWVWVITWKCLEVLLIKTIIECIRTEKSLNIRLFLRFETVKRVGTLDTGCCSWTTLMHALHSFELYLC